MFRHIKFDSQIPEVLDRKWKEKSLRIYKSFPPTLESGTDVGHGITVGLGKFLKKNKRRA
jgi:hypothetical protein